MFVKLNQRFAALEQQDEHTFNCNDCSSETSRLSCSIFLTETSRLSCSIFLPRFLQVFSPVTIVDNCGLNFRWGFVRSSEDEVETMQSSAAHIYVISAASVTVR